MTMRKQVVVDTELLLIAMAQPGNLQEVLQAQDRPIPPAIHTQVGVAIVPKSPGMGTLTDQHPNPLMGVVLPPPIEMVVVVAHTADIRPRES